MRSFIEERILGLLRYIYGKSLISCKTRYALIAFTTRCNLRCVYCAVSTPGYEKRARDLDEGYLAEIINELKRRDVKQVSVHGHGETTILKNWRCYCDQLHQEGFSLNIVTSLALNYNEDEIDTLSRFNSIGISCDTVDYDLFRQLRRGSDLPVVVENLAKIKEASKKRQNTPRIFIYCTVMDKNISKLNDLVKFWVGKGADGFKFSNFTRYDMLDNSLLLRHPTAMSFNELKAAKTHLEEAMDTARRYGKDVDCHKALIESINKKLNDSETKIEHKTPLKYTYTTDQAKGMTRDCIDPWNFFMIHSDAAVMPCCWHRPVGRLGSDSLNRILNGWAITRLRLGLLKGRLDDDCKVCPAKGWIERGKLKQKIINEVSCDGIS